MNVSVMKGSHMLSSQSKLYPGVNVYLVLEIFDTFLYVYSATTFLGHRYTVAFFSLLSLPQKS